MARAGAERVVLWRVARSASRGALVWGTVFGLIVLSSVVSYANAYPTVASRKQMAASLGANAGLQAMFGVPRQLDTVAGFTAWRSMGLLGIIGGVWGVLVATRLLRGEEDAGRWELLLAGGVTRGRAAAEACVGLLLAAVALWVPLAVLSLAAGATSDAHFAVRSSLFLSFALALPVALFVAVGALTSQVCATRRQASGLGAATLGLWFVLRFVADSGDRLRWLRWLSPLGWVGELHPFTGSDLAPVALVVCLTAVCFVAAVVLAGRRDLGGSTLPDRASAAPRLRHLASAGGLAVRLARGSAIAWVVGLALGSMFFGLVAKAAGESITRSSSLAKELDRLGIHVGGATAYLGVAFVTVTALVALQAANHVAATREEEALGRADNLLVQPVSRARWIAGRVGVAVVCLTATALAAAGGAWVGAATQDSGVSITRLLAAGMNSTPSALLVLGVGTLLHALAPRRAVLLTYALVAWSFLVEVVGASLKLDHRLLDTSVFHHVAAAPAADPRWGTNLVFVVLALAAFAAGIVALRRRDLVGA